MNSANEKNIYLHVGTHKTGSSAIQWTFRHSTQHLSEHGFKYIKNPHGIFIEPTLREGAVSESIIEQAKANLEELLLTTKEDNVILSHEVIFGQPEIGFSNNASNLERVLRIIGEHPCKVIIFLRRQDYFVESMYGQRVKRNFTGSFKEFMNGLSPGCFDWNRMIATYENRLGKENLKILPYMGDVVEQFYEYLGIPAYNPVPEKPWKMNPSLTLYGMELKRRCNAHLETLDEMRRLKCLTQEFFPMKAGNPFNFVSGKERQQFLETYKDGNEALESRYGLKLFPEITDIEKNKESTLKDIPEIHDGTIELISVLVSNLIKAEQELSNR